MSDPDDTRREPDVERRETAGISADTAAAIEAVVESLRVGVAKATQGFAAKLGEVTAVVTALPGREYADEETEIAEIYHRIDRELAVAEARADRLLAQRAAR
nr:hypothetical protein [uncultured Rhodopila sp.]